MSSPPIIESLHRLMRAYKFHMRRALQDKQLGLPITHIRVLKGIYRNPECTAQSIAQKMQCDKAQITRVLNELLREALIERRDNPADRRSRLLLLTEKGREVMALLQSVERQTVVAMTSKLNREEVDEFVRLAAAMAKNLSGDPESPHH